MRRIFYATKGNTMKPGIILPSLMSPEQYDHFCKWLRKNGIDPNRVPMYARIICHGNRITYKKFKVRQNRRGGKLLVLDSRWMTAWDTKTTRIRVPFEAHK